MKSDRREDPFASLCDAMSFSPRDWSEDHRDAWIYGIVVGWGDALGEVATGHGWSPETVARLRRLRDAFVRAGGQ